MAEESEEKDARGVTISAQLVPGMGEIIRDLYVRQVLLGLIADTTIGTYRNVLYQHGLWDFFRVFSISDELGVRKPHRLMFDRARLEGKQYDVLVDRILMVGNNYPRDIAGGKQAGFDTCWFHWNNRYPMDIYPGAADGIVDSAAALSRWIDEWLNTVTPAREE
jgi:putative hydrolase of the HAD superfamily